MITLLPEKIALKIDAIKISGIFNLIRSWLIDSATFAIPFSVSGDDDTSISKSAIKQSLTMRFLST